MAIDYGTDLGQVRLLISDIDEDNLILGDNEINGFLGIEPTVKRAAASALETIANSEALVAKKIRTQDLSTDGPAVAESLRKRAATLRKESDEGDTGSYFDIIDYDPHPRTSAYELSETEWT